MLGLGLNMEVVESSLKGFTGILDKFTGAVAAYSTRKLIASQPNILPADYGDGAAAAYSLRKVKASYSGNCIDVRRSSDNTTSSIGFSGNELDTTALEAFVNEDVDTYTSDFSSTEDLAETNGTGAAAQSVGGVDDAYKFTTITGTGQMFASTSPFSGKGGGNSFRIQADVYLPSTNAEIDKVRMWTGYGLEGFAEVTATDTWTSIDETLEVVSGSQLRFQAYDGSDLTPTTTEANVFYIKDVVVTQTTADGFVTKWYDQSGTNHAEQGTDNDQPQIVDAGSTILENGKPAIQFDGVDDELINSSITLTQPFTYFHARKYRNTTTLRMALSLSTSTNGWADYLDGGQLRAFFGGSKSIAAGFNTNQNLWGAIVNGASSEVLLNGVSTAANLGTNNGDAVVIGDRGNISGVNAAVNVQEIIIYDSDQSGNRQDIEWNINNHYNIYTNSWDKQSAMQVRRAIDNETTNIGFVGKDLDTAALESFATESSPVLDDYTGAAAAYSLRKVRSAYTGDAIEVRRSSNGDTLDIGFDANGYLDTAALTTFVNSGEAFTNSDISSATGWTIASGTTYNALTEAFDVIGGAGLTVRQNASVSGHTFTITIVVDRIDSGGFTIYAGGTQSAQINTAGTHTLTIVGGSSNSILAMNPDSLCDCSVSSFSAIDTTADGAVKVWYDQSVNGYNATQNNPNRQPLVVSGGTLVEENGKAAIEFDGSDDWLNTGITSSQFSQAFVVKNTTGTGTAIGYSGAVALQSTVYNTADDDITFSSGSGLYTIDNLNVKSYLNGVDETGAATTFTQTFNRLYLGSVNGSSSFINGKFQEYVHFAYASDQSANRTGIEGNIGRYYNIDGFRDVFVSKWYDQSGNFNHAENSTDFEQPLIVSGGDVIEENGKVAIQFDGVNDMLQKDFDPDIAQPLTLFHVRRYRSNGLFGAIGYDTTAGTGYGDINVANDFRSYYGSYLGTTTQNTNQGLWYSLGNGTSSEVGLDGATAETGDAGTAGLKLLSIGSVVGSFDAPINTQEIIIFNSDQSSNREDIENNINKHFKIYEE